MFLIWLTTNLFVLGFLGAAGFMIGLLGLISDKKYPRLPWMILGPAGFIASCVAMLALVAGQPSTVWLPPLLLAVGCGLGFSKVAARWAAKRLRLLPVFGNPRLYWAFLLIASPVGACCLAIKPSETSKFSALRQSCVESLQEGDAHLGLTDKGRSLKLLTMPADAFLGFKMQEAEAEAIQQWNVSLRLIRTAGPNLRCNCHGWVFADGQFWIDNADIERILQDNGYESVAYPQAGDLVIYAADDGEIVHSGIVRAAESDGLVLIESKWGLIGRFLHRPELQPCACQWRYLHRSRPTHRINIVDR